MAFTYLKGEILHETEALKKLIIENPDLPLLVFAGEDANIGDYSYMCCEYVRVEKGEVLDCKGPNDEIIYTDRQHLKDDIEEAIYDDYDGIGKIPDDKLDKMLKERMSKYDEYWKDCILLYVTN